MIPELTYEEMQQALRAYSAGRLSRHLTIKMTGLDCVARLYQEMEDANLPLPQAPIASIRRSEI